jgi:hypothetical protein
MEDLTKRHKTGLINFKKKIIHKEIDYYKRLNDPEHVLKTGYSTEQRLQIAIDKLNKDYFFSKIEIANYLRSEAIDCYRLAINFNENIFLKIKYLRLSVYYINDLFTAHPELKVYSKKAIVNPNISLIINEK